ncbi:MAG: hypothetical protein IT305_07905 [Chloroflexi bacterium]|nr:hypothetical protein [Chloroflexota bacterium]
MPVLYDDQYRGPRWRYGLRRQHLVHYLTGPASDWILFSERRSSDPRFPFGTIDFARELPEHVAQALDLLLVSVQCGSPRGSQCET